MVYEVEYRHNGCAGMKRLKTLLGIRRYIERMGITRYAIAKVKQVGSYNPADYEIIEERDFTHSSRYWG
jgi:hypothetical protein